MITMEAHPGEHITAALDRAIALANEHNSRVQFAFNDIQVVVQPGELAPNLQDLWQRELDARAAAWRASPAGIAAAAEAAARMAKCQADHDRLMAELPGIVREEIRLVDWCAEFSEAADHRGVKGRDFPRVIALLEGAGWKKNDMVGQHHRVSTSYTAMARWIIGQTINCLSSDMPPHPICRQFAEDYRVLRARGRA